MLETEVIAAIQRQFPKRDVVARLNAVRTSILEYEGQTHLSWIFEALSPASSNTIQVETENSPGFHQLMDTATIPYGFFNRCPGEIKNSLFTYFSNRDSKPYLFRMYQEPTNQQLHLRAVLSSRYRTQDDDVVIPAVLNGLREFGDNAFHRTVETSEYTTRYTMQFNDLSVRDEQANRTYHAGISVTNSETGQAAVYVEPIVIGPHFVIYNRKALADQGIRIFTQHRTEFNAEWVREAVAQARRVGQIGIVAFLERQNQLLTQVEAIRILERLDPLSEHAKMVVEEEFKEIESITRGNFVRRITELAEQLPIFKKHRLEVQLGDLAFNVFDQLEARISNIVLDND